MNIRIFNAEPDNFSDEARRILELVGEVVEKKVTQDELVSNMAGVDALIVRFGLRITRDLMAACGRLKVISTAATGLDHIDCGAAEELKITVLSLNGEDEFLKDIYATAEHTWGLILSLVRRVPWAFDDVRRGGWDRDKFRGADLKGKRLGIVGLGRIGRDIAHYASTFGMRVGAYDPFRDGWIEGVRRFNELEELLKWSDLLSIHIPLKDQTRNLIKEKDLRLMPKGAWVINTSRGGIIEEMGLMEALADGHIAGAALDVVEGKTLLDYAARHTNLLITPHLGGATAEAMEKTEIFMARKLRRFFSNAK